MHRPFQKFGFFVSKSVNAEANAKNDKTVQCLYRKDSSVGEKSPKRKIKSAHDAEDDVHARRRTTEERNRSRRKTSRELSAIGRRKRNSSVRGFPSGTETRPEEVKRHRKEVHHSRQRRDGRSNVSNDVKSERRKVLREEDIVRLLKHCKGKKDTISEDSPLLIKKDIFKMWNEVPKNTGSTSFFKRLFAFDRETSSDKKDSKPREKHERRKLHSGNERNDTMFDNTDRQKERRKNTHRKEEQKYPSDEHKRERHRSRSKMVESDVVRKYRKVDTVSGKKQQSKAVETESRLISQEIKFSRDKETDKKTTSARHKISKDKTKVKSETPKNKQQLETTKTFKEELHRKLESISRVNPVRHKHCLVKNTFSIVDIPPQDDSFLERKKKSRVFRKYYDYYRNGKDSEVTSSCYHTFSDSHKMYQDFSEQSLRESSKQRDQRPRKNVGAERSLKLEYHVSAVNISPKVSRVCNKVASESKDNRRKSKIKLRKSKIPIFSPTPKVVELANGCLRASEPLQTSADLFIARNRKEDESRLNLKANVETEVKHKSFLKMSSRNASTERSTDTIAYSDKSEKVRVEAKPLGQFSPRNATVEQTEGKSARTTPRRRIEGNKGKPSSTYSSRTTSPERQTPRSKPSSGELELASPKAHRRNFEIGSPRSLSSRSASEQRIKKETVKSRFHDKKSRTLSEPSRSKNLSNFPPKTSNIEEICLRVNHKNKASSKTNETPRMTSRNSTLTKQRKLNSSERQFDSKKFSNNRQRDFQKSRNGTFNAGPKSKKSHSKLSNDDTSLVWSKSAISSKSDTGIEENNKANMRNKPENNKSSTRASVSSSTFGDKSTKSTKNETSLLLTKSYKDDDKLSRWQKRKMYSDTLRKNLIKRSQKTAAVRPQVLEVRYLTVTNDREELAGASVADARLNRPETTAASGAPKQFYDDDLPPACVELVEPEKFKHIFESSVDTALNEILTENCNFLKKDFSFASLNDLCKDSSSEGSVSSADFPSPHEDKRDEWRDFRVPSDRSVNEICPLRRISDVKVQPLDLGSRDRIVDSLSAPSSEESGYSTLESRQMSGNFFERPEIKALFDPPSMDSYCVEIQIARSSSSSCGLTIRSIESKSLQTSVERVQKSVQTSSERREEEANDECEDEITARQQSQIVDDETLLQESQEATPSLESVEYCKDKCNSVSIPTTNLEKLVEKTKQIFGRCSVDKLLIYQKRTRRSKKKLSDWRGKVKFNLSSLSCFKRVSSDE